MRRDQAAEIARGTTVDVGDATSGRCCAAGAATRTPGVWCRARRPLSPGYPAAIGVAIGACVLLPYREELVRCRRAARAGKRRARAHRAVLRKVKGS